MDERVFLSKDMIPDDISIKSNLGKAFGFYEKINKLTEGLLYEWKFYNKSGWIYKIFDKKKALLWLVPFKDSININLTLRENEKDFFLKSDLPEKIKEKFLSAKKYPEGYALFFTIKKTLDFNNIKYILENLMTLR